MVKMAFISCVAAIFIFVLCASYLLLDSVSALFGLNPWFGVFWFLASVVAAFRAARRASRGLKERFRLPPSRSGLNPKLSVVLVTAYILTWAVAVPGVQSENTRWAIEEYKKLYGLDSGVGGRVRGTDPQIRTFLAVPVLPGVVLSYHEYQLADLYGWRGWDVHFWYGNGVVRLLSMPLWMS